MEDNMQQKYINATKVECIYTRRGDDDSIYVDGTITIDDRIVYYTFEIEDVWEDGGTRKVTIDVDDYTFRILQFWNRRVYIRDDDMPGLLEVGRDCHKSDITSPLIAKMVDDSDYIYNAITYRATEYGENDRYTHLLWVRLYFATCCDDDIELEITNVKKIDTGYEGRFAVSNVNFRFVYEEDEQGYEITKLAYEDDPYEAWDDFEEYLGRARDYIWSKIYHYITELEKGDAADESI